MKPNFKTSQIASAVSLTAAMLAAAGSAHAGVGFADVQWADGTMGRVQTYFSHSPSGPHRYGLPELTAGSAEYRQDIVDTLRAQGATVDTVTGIADSGKALRKFVDKLPGLGQAGAVTLADGTQKYIPVAVAAKWTNPQGVVTADDYFEIATVEYSEKMHSDLPKATTLRGYVQIDHLATNGLGALAGSKQVALTYPNGAPIMVQKTDANGKLVVDAAGKKVMVQAIAVDNPHYLGPAIVATKNVPTRLKFHNLLPVGRAQTGGVDALGNTIVTARNGDLALPVDGSLVGAGYGPDGITKYTQNRTSIHLHGGDTPWVSDGTALQWYTPAGEADASNPLSLAASFTDPATGVTDTEGLSHFLRGSSAQNVPDMNEPGDGAYTFYYPNGQAARLLWYHDHAAGLTRLNVMMGMAAPYVLTDSTEQGLISNGVIPDAAHTIPLVLQEKNFVPQDIALQDSRWNTTAWGAPGDFWQPNVYETVQDPAQMNSWNAVGRWHYGPWFWPVFPALYPLPTGAYGDETTTPENWGDTPVINGVAYPSVDVDPTAYRLRILNASNDRMFSFNLFQADTTKPSPFDATNFGEVPMVPAAVPANPCAAGELRSTFVNGSYCTPETWAFDGRNGGVPDPAAQGPALYQIANEGGFLPKVAIIEPAPTVPIYDVGRVTVLNVSTSGLWLGNAERADVIADFSAYAGKTLIAYNDMNAPVPAGDPRNDYFTGVGDQSPAGGAEDTLLGYGPNTRTLMQFKVRNVAPSAAFDLAKLQAELPKAYGASQERPVVAQSAYNTAFNESWTDAQAYGSIYTGSLKQPQFQFTPGTATAFGGITMGSGGAGYITPPAVTINGGGGTGATATSTLKIQELPVTNAGTGYTIAPLVRISSLAGGSGATATSELKLGTVVITNGGSGYATTQNGAAVTFSVPQVKGGVAATGKLVVTGGKVTGVTITNAGSGYTAAPIFTMPAPAGTGTKVKATATAYGAVSKLNLTAPDPTNPTTAGGGGYNDLSANGLTITINPPQAAATATFTPVQATAMALGTVYDITLNNVGSGYTSLPTISVAAPPATPAGVTPVNARATATAAGNVNASYLVKTKAIQELFDPTYGRLNATLGIELPFTNGTTQTTIPLGFVDAPTEVIGDNETQIWKLTHNGVDTHPVHFHLYNVQVINRVGWDGFVSPPADNELGWKETVRMHPLEDIILAVRAKKPTTPGWGAPESIRPLDETQPLGSPFGFTQIDVNTGLPAVVVNTMQNFGWEYTWHCHILGHEENDFMRPVVFKANEAIPAVPGAPAAVVGGTAAAPTVALSWADNALTEYKYEVQRADVNSGVVGTFATIATLPANSTAYTDSVALNSSFQYKVVAIGAAGASTSVASATVSTGLTAPVAPSKFAVSSATATTVALGWLDNANNESGYVLTRTGGTGAAVTWNLAANAVNFVDTTVVAGTAYTYTLIATNAAGNSASVVTGANTPAAVVLASPTVATPTIVRGSVTLNWGRVTGAANYVVQYRIAGSNAAWTPRTTATRSMTLNLARTTAYEIQVIAQNAAGVQSAPTALSVTTR